MTVKKLHAALEILIQAGAGRRKVVIDKETYRHPLESDGCVLLDVARVRMQTNPIIDDDGGTTLNKDGTERTQQSVVLSGNEIRCPSCGSIDDHGQNCPYSVTDARRQ